MTSLQAFLGGNPQQVSIKDRREKILVDFGKIRLPSAAVDGDKVPEVQNKYGCIVQEEGPEIFVYPGFLKDYQLMITIDGELMNRLKSWFMDYSSHVVGELLS